MILPLGATPMLALVQFVRGSAGRSSPALCRGPGQPLRRTLDPADPAYHPFIGAWGCRIWLRPPPIPARSDTADSYLGQLEFSRSPNIRSALAG